MRNFFKKAIAVLMAAAACMTVSVGSYIEKSVSALTIISDIKDVIVDKSVISVGESTKLSVDWDYDYGYKRNSYIYSSDESIVKVENTSENGCTLIGVGVGTAKITVKNDPYSKTVEVEVVNESSVKGDVNGNGEFNVADVVMLQKALVTNSVTPDMDINGDGKVNVFDLVAAKRMLADVIGRRVKSLTARSWSFTPLMLLTVRRISLNWLGLQIQATVKGGEAVYFTLD